MQMPLPFDLLPMNKWIALKGMLPSPDKEHRIIVVNLIDTEVQYFYVTSQIEKVKFVFQNDSGSITKTFNKNDWDALSKDSCIPCNRKNLYRISLDELRYRYENQSLDYLGPIPDTVKDEIIRATCSSDSFDEEEKKLYTT